MSKALRVLLLAAILFLWLVFIFWLCATFAEFSILSAFLGVAGLAMILAAYMRYN